MDKSGYVYLVHIEKDVYKFGQTKNVQKRFRELRWKHKNASLLHSIFVHDRKGMEDFLLCYFRRERDRRYGLEYVHLTPDDVQWFSSRPDFYEPEWHLDEEKTDRIFREMFRRCGLSWDDVPSEIA